MNALNKGTAACESQVSSTLLSLNKAIAEQKEKLDAAKRGYESAVAGGGMAGTEQELVLMQLDVSLENARTTLSDYEEELAQAMQETFPSDFAELECLFAELETALDSNTGKEVLDLFAQLHEMDNTIVMITHDLPVASHAKRMVRIIDGMLFEENQFSDVPSGNESRSLSRQPDSIIEAGGLSGGNGVFMKESFCSA